MWKGTKCDLFDCEKYMYLQSDSRKPVFWRFIDTLPKKLYAKIDRETVTEQFLNKWQKYVKMCEKSDFSYLEKWHLERFKQTCLLTVH